MRPSLLICLFVLAGLSLPTSASALTPCRAYTGFSLKVAQTDCQHGRAVQRAYFNDPPPSSCGRGCIVETRGERWRCKPRVGSGYYVNAYDETIRGRVWCHRLRDGARARWVFSGGGD